MVTSYKYLNINNKGSLIKYLSSFDCEMTGADIRNYVFSTNQGSSDFRLMTGEDYSDTGAEWYYDFDKVKEFDLEIERFKKEYIVWFKEVLI